MTLRQSLIADRTQATAPEIMMIDAAIIAYFNMLRTQRWIGNLSLVVERKLFGQEPLNQIHGAAVGNRLEEQIGPLAEVIDAAPRACRTDEEQAKADCIQFNKDKGIL
jgi:hypothetical protein